MTLLLKKITLRLQINCGLSLLQYFWAILFQLEVGTGVDTEYLVHSIHPSEAAGKKKTFTWASRFIETNFGPCYHLKPLICRDIQHGQKQTSLINRSGQHERLSSYFICFCHSTMSWIQEMNQRVKVQPRLSLPLRNNDQPYQKSWTGLSFQDGCIDFLWQFATNAG